MVEYNPIVNQSPEVSPSQGAICKHHWMIETPNGPTSNGTCKNCGDERTFVNYQVDKPYQRYFRGELDLTQKQEEGYHREAGVIPGDIKRTGESILPKNGKIGGRF